MPTRDPSGNDQIHLIPLETPVSKLFSFRVHAALVDGLLIDTGFRHARSRFLRALAGRRVEQAVNTHAHEDHSGNNLALLERLAVRLHAPAAALPALARPWLDTRHLYQRVIWGLPEPSAPEPLAGEIGTERFTFRVVPTPGHSLDHVCLFEPDQGWLFAGDLYLGTRVTLARPYENGIDLIASLERVADLEPRVLVCYHRGVVKEPVNALRRKLEWLRQLRERIHQLHGRGVAPDAIARRLLGPDPSPLRLLTGGDVSSANLVRSFLKEPGEGYKY
jgi:glyoxylase-like metal-dependent hydrolase (beta-lactamase superfamily II)